MPQSYIGGTITLEVFVYEYDGGPALDPDDPITVDITLNGTSVLDEPFTYNPGDIVKVGTGHYKITWDIPEDAAAGNYVAEWSFNIDDNTVTGTETFYVALSPVVTPGSETLGQQYIIEWAGELDPLYLDPELLKTHFPDATSLEIAEHIHYFSKEVQARLSNNAEPSFVELDYILAATACALSRIYDPLGIVGDGVSFRLGDLSVTNRSMPRQSITRSNAYTWCELAAALRIEVLGSRVGIKSVVAGAAHRSPIPSRKISVPAHRRPFFPQYGTSDDSERVPGEF